MAAHSTRRNFLGVLAASGMACGLAADAQPAESSAPETTMASIGPAQHPGIDAELTRRAAHHLAQSRLLVDYYRIYRKLTYPLPVAGLSVPNIVIPSLPKYPWATWMLWALEERIDALGWAAEWQGNKDAQAAAVADLTALAHWPEYRQFAGPDLSSAHAGRILWKASRWSWLSADLRETLRAACRRHVDSVLPESNKAFGAIHGKEDVLRQAAPHKLLHNIPLIGTIGAALTAAAAKHPGAAALNAQITALFGATLELRSQGWTEGLGYDGYVLDFMADWLTTLPADARVFALEHPNLQHYFAESYMLGAPGAVGQAAELSDVEPRQMPFHFSAHAKLFPWLAGPQRAWLLSCVPLDWLRTDALAALRQITAAPQPVAPQPGALDAHYVAVLRTGWEPDDTAVTAACSPSPMSHIQCDNGTLVIGTQRRWLIADPGYQQYVHGDERDFTIGPTAHNAPLINGLAQTEKRPQRLALDNPSPGVSHTAIDLTACYPAKAALQKLVRHVWLAGKDLVIVADQLAAPPTTEIAYHWHGHPDCAWWLDANWALLTVDNAQLGFTSPQVQFSGANLQRLPGTRGQLTLICTCKPAPPVVWWAFTLGKQRLELHTDADGRALRVQGRTFRV